MRSILMISLALSSGPVFADMMSEMSSNPQIAEYVRSHPSVILNGMTFMNNHPDLEKRGAAALKDPAIQRELKELGLTEIMGIAMHVKGKPQAPKPAAQTTAKPSAKPASAVATAPAVKNAKVAAPKKVATAAPAKPNTATSAGIPRLNSTYVVREQAGLKQSRQKAFNLASPGVHLVSAKAREVTEKDGRKSHWLQVADAKGNTGWVNFRAKHNLGNSTVAVAQPAAAPAKAVAESPKVEPGSAASKFAVEAPKAESAPLQAPPPQAPTEVAGAKPQGPKITDLPPLNDLKQAETTTPAPAPVKPTAAEVVTAPQTEVKAEPKAEDTATPVQTAKAEEPPPKKEEPPVDPTTALECAKSFKEFQNKELLKKEFGSIDPFGKWKGPLPGILVVPNANKDGFEIELPLLARVGAEMAPISNEDSKKRVTAMLEEMAKSPKGNRASFEFNVCIAGDGKGPYLDQFGQRQYFSKDRKSVLVGLPGMDAKPFVRATDDAPNAGSTK